jgi:hypothetical protein
MLSQLRSLLARLGKARWVVAGGLGLVAIGIASFALFGSSKEEPSQPAPTREAPTTQSPPPPTSGGGSSGSGGGTEPTWAGLATFKRRCHNLDLRGGRARVLYEPRMEMTRGDSEAVRAAVTLDPSTPADRVLHRTGAADEPGLVVSCRVQAQLTASKYQFDLDEKGWVQRSLYTADTARWSWYVTPKVGGTHTLTLRLRPIVKTQSEDRTAPASFSAENSNLQEYETTAHVDVPLLERPQETMSRLAATLKVAEGLVTALTALLAALIALAGVLGVRRRRKQRATA